MVLSTDALGSDLTWPLLPGFGKQPTPLSNDRFSVLTFKAARYVSFDYYNILNFIRHKGSYIIQQSIVIIKRKEKQLTILQ